MNFTYAGPGQTMIQAANGTVGYVQALVTATGIDTIVAISGGGQSGLVGSHSTQPLVAELRDAGRCADSWPQHQLARKSWKRHF